MISEPLHSPRLVGREVEFGALLRLAAESAGRSGTVVLVEGEAGIGKTRFLEELQAWGTRRASVVSVTCPSFAPAPFGPVCAILDALLPDTRLESDPRAEGANAGQIEVFRRIAGALRGAAAARPLVILLDDAHWSDTATLEFVHYAARELADAPLMLVVAYRSDELAESHALQSVVARVARLANVHRIALRALSGVATSELLDLLLPDGRRLERDTLRDVRDRAEGNALFAVELLKSALEGRQGVGTQTVRGLVEARASQLTPEHRRLLELAALIGRRFDAALLQKLSGLADRTELHAFLRNAVRNHFLAEERDAVGWFAFRHALVRDAVLEGILLVEARELHLTIGRTLERETDSLERAAELSEHFWQGGALKECAPYARAAGKRALERFAYREAAEQFDRAIACPGAEDDLDVYDGAAVAHTSLGNPDAIGFFETAARIAERSGAHDRAVDALLGIAIAKFRNRDVDGVVEAFGRAQAIVDAHPSPRMRLGVLIQRAQLALAGAWSRDCVPALIAEAQSLLAWARPIDAYLFYTVRGTFGRDPKQASADFDLSVSFANEVGRPRTVLAAMGNRALWSLNHLPARAALELFDETLAFAERYGDLYHALSTWAHIANARIAAGLLDAALDALRVLLAEPSPTPLADGYRAEAAVRLAVYLRDDGLIQRAGATAAFEGAASRPIQFWGKLAVSLAEFHSCNGDARAAQALIARLAGRPEMVEIEVTNCRLLPGIGALGTQEHVRAVSAVVEPWRASSNAITQAHLTLFDAYAAARFGSGEATHELAERAAGEFAALQMPLREAEAAVLAGMPARATTLMKACGARRLPARLVDATSGAKRGHQLSAREGEVAALAATGLPSTAIAERLHLSARTVEAHLASAYKKLGVNSRAALRAALDDEMLSTPNATPIA